MRPSAWMRVEGIIKTLWISHATLYRWMARDLPHHKVGRVVLFDLAEVENWIRAHGSKQHKRRRRRR